MNNLDSISSISPVSFTDIDNNNTLTQSVLTSDTYKEIMNEAKKLNKKNIISNNNNFGVMSVKQGIPSYLETYNNDSATSSFNQSLLDKDVAFSSTSSAFMSEIMGKQSGGNDNFSATSTFDEKLINNTVSATSSAFMTEIMQTQAGGVARKRRVNAKETIDEDSSTSSTSESDDDDDDSSSSDDVNMNSSEATTSSDENTEETDATTSDGKFISGTRYLYSETQTENSYRMNNKSFFDSDMSSTLATEDLTLLKK
jgi:hypothetical protein